MRHNKHHASLGITREHRSAMLSNMGASLIKHGRIETTLTKAKALRPFIEKVITKAKKAAALPKENGKLSASAIHLRRLALKDVRDESAVTLLFNEKVAQFEKRSGGYTRIYKIGARSAIRSQRWAAADGARAGIKGRCSRHKDSRRGAASLRRGTGRLRGPSWCRGGARRTSFRAKGRGPRASP